MGQGEFRIRARFIEFMEAWRVSHEDEETSHLLTSERLFPLFRREIA